MGHFIEAMQVFPIDDVSFHCADYLNGEPYLPGLPFWVFM
jgi:hypothetical protein